MTTQQRDDLCFQSIEESSRLIHSGQLSPVELTQAYLDRIEDIDDKVGGYITVLAESALAEAREAEKAIANGQSKGPLHGIPMAHKDLYDTKGVLTTGGSQVMRDRVPEHDATVIAKLKEAGGVLLGKHTMSEFAMGAPASLGATPRNPWNLGHTPGGSSSGTGAAVAAALCAGGLGSDTGGSIRGPASLNGIVGMIPTYGRASRYGVLPLSWSLDHAGPLTRTVEDTALMMQAISGHDPKDPSTSTNPVPDFRAACEGGVRGMKIGIPRHAFTGDDKDVDAETVAAVERAITDLEEMGADVREVHIPGLEHLRTMGSAIFMSEAYTYYQHLLRSQKEDFGAPFRRYVYAGGLFTGSDYVQALRARAKLKRSVARIFAEVDVMVLPTSSEPASKLDVFAAPDPTRFIRGAWFTMIFNMTSCPAISLPCGFTEAGLPIGLQIAGSPFDEASVLRAAYAYQQQSGFASMRPPIE